VVPPCSAQEISSIFSPIGGRCNNINNPILGTVNKPFRRLLAPCDRDIFNTTTTLLIVNEEEDDRSGNNSSEEGGGSWLRPWPSSPGTVQCNTGNKLPNARLVSRTIHTDKNVQSNKAQFFTIFGQFVCHDVLSTQTQTTVGNCCSPSGQTDTVNCLPIIVPAGDPFFNTSQCLNFNRAIIFCNQTGQNRHHVNGLTAYLDAGNIYGSDQTRSLSIRALSGGLLKVTTPGNLLPKLGSTPLFTAGEGRAIENPGLTTVHTLFMREHNRIAELIAQRNSSMTDTEIYNHARRIVTAEYQNNCLIKMIQ